MDPISQGAIGAVAAQTLANREKMVALAWLGCAAGMAPDLDIFIQSPTDPLLFLKFHRHFTHALIFIPIGALIVASALYPLARRRLRFKEAYLACLLGYATHGLLDACTSYGTQLFWPFTDMRVAWNNVSVVDPMFTLPLLSCVIYARQKFSRAATYAGIAWVFIYLSFGALQMFRAQDLATELAHARGHDPQRLTLKVSFANLVLWKSIYEHEGHYYVDGIRVAIDESWCPGHAVEKLDINKHLPFLQPGSQQAADLERFRWFSDDYLTPTGEPGGVTDMRYSMVPNEVDPMWGVTLSAEASATEHVQWWSTRDASASKRSTFYKLLMGEGCQPLSTATTQALRDLPPTDA